MQFILGLVVGAALMWLAQWLQRKGIAIRWYEWLVAALGFMMLVWTVNDYFGSIAEHNEAASRVFLWLLGTPAVILLGLAVFLPWWRMRRSKIVAKLTDAKQ
ncbi:MAG: dehalogenase [Dehalococcoidia bacterium]|nr:MAG: dehalogenase [Dehalococcoidia bacterium]